MFKALTLLHWFLFAQMSTKEKLISHVMKEEPVGCRNKVTVVGVGMVGMASAISVLLKVSGAQLRDNERWQMLRGVEEGEERRIVWTV